MKTNSRCCDKGHGETYSKEGQVRGGRGSSGTRRSGTASNTSKDLKEEVGRELSPGLWGSEGIKASPPAAIKAHPTDSRVPTTFTGRSAGSELSQSNTKMLSAFFSYADVCTGE